MSKTKYCEICKKDTWHKLVRTPMLAFMVVVEKYECEECRRRAIKQFGEYISKHKQLSDSL